MLSLQLPSFFFFFNDTATTEIYTLSLHDALPIWCIATWGSDVGICVCAKPSNIRLISFPLARTMTRAPHQDRKSTRLNSSHDQISYAVFCLKKKKITNTSRYQRVTDPASLSRCRA